MNVFIGTFFQVLLFPVVKTENLEGGFLRSSYLIFCLQPLEIMTQFLFKSCVRNEIWLKKSTEISNYDKFICDILE